ncbi:MFS transporter [Methanophagales archaeon]|nr:MAG: MFS transporter [Methanophagales archaeon]
MKMNTQPAPAPTLVPFIALHGLMHILATTLPALSPLVKAEFQLTNTGIGILSFAFATAIGLGSILSGMLSDRYDGMMLIGIGFISAAIFSGLLFLSYDLFSLTLIFIIMGFFLSLYHPSALSYIAKTFKIRRGKVFGVHEIGGSVGIAIAPLIAGFICFYTGWRFVYLFLAFPATFFTFLLFRMVREGKMEWVGNKQMLFSDANPNINSVGLKLFLRQAISTGSIRRIYVTEGLFGFVIGGSLTFIPIFLNEAKGLSPDLAVILTCVFTGGGAIGKFVGGHFSDLVGGRKVMAYGFFLAAPLFFIVPFLPLMWAILALALAGLIFPTILPAIITTIGKEVPVSRTGIAFGLMMFAGFGLGSASRIILGLVSDSFGISTVFYPIVIAVLFGGCLNVCIPARRFFAK